ncbi:MAG: hypothetical protein AAF530_03025 [Pseudomonadota bacterium]
MPPDGAYLFDLVRDYADLGDHRTGTAVDRATLAWFAGRLAEIGAHVDLLDFDFPRFTGSWHLSRDGSPVEALPLYYQSRGSLNGVSPAVAEIDADRGEAAVSANIEQEIERASAAGHKALVLATRCETDGLVAKNRTLQEADGIATFLVAGVEAHGSHQAEWRLTCDLNLEPGRSATVIGKFASCEGPNDLPPWVITTPLSGWFRCAGERGTGIALCLHLARFCARAQRPLWIIAPSGHELGYMGAYRFLETYQSPVQGVFHIGSSVACHGRQLRLTANLPGEKKEPLRAAAARLGAAFVVPKSSLNPGSWWGESECWAPRGHPMVSIAGWAPHFHTPMDLPELVTSPDLLIETASNLLRIGQVLFDD